MKTWHKVAIGAGVVVVLGGIVLFSVNQANKGVVTVQTAKVAKQDEFYTQYVDIQKEVEAYLEFDPATFRRKIVYCNCDDPFESNFFKYFLNNFEKLRLKNWITNAAKGCTTMA